MLCVTARLETQVIWRVEQLGARVGLPRHRERVQIRRWARIVIAVCLIVTTLDATDDIVCGRRDTV